MWSLSASGLKPLPSGARRKAVLGRQQAAKAVGRKLGAGAKFIEQEVIARRVRVIPAEIDDNVIPAMGQEFFFDVFGVGHHLIFGDGVAESVVAVPAHRRRRGEVVEGKFRPAGLRQGPERNGRRDEEHQRK